jgi:AraC-like DNA-binding protein
MMNPNDAHLKIEYLDIYRKMYPYSDSVLPGSNLIIWVRGVGLQNDHEVIYCLRDHHLPGLSIDAGSTATVISISENLLEMINGYTFPFFERRLFALYSPVMIRIDRKKQETLETILETIEEELNETAESQSEILKVLVMLFLLRLSECGTSNDISEEGRNESLFAKKYLDLVQAHFLEWKRVSIYADHLCVTPNYLNAKIKRITGYTAGYHIQQRIILEAKRQARRNGLRLKEVAHYLGFDDTAHFSKYFKNGTGINFSSYLKADRVF